jgi:hypothetical protein
MPKERLVSPVWKFNGWFHGEALSFHAKVMGSDESLK